MSFYQPSVLMRYEKFFVFLFNIFGGKVLRRAAVDQGKGHKIYPYLLRVWRSIVRTKVWCADLTYIPMARGFVYLVVVMVGTAAGC